MSDYYTARKKRGLYNPSSREPFALSRTKIDLFMECPRCFYLDRRLGVARPPGFPFTLNSAVDHLLKKEFDFHRAAQKAHPLMSAYGINAVPLEHPDFASWRELDFGRGGVHVFHELTLFNVYGVVDDVWTTPDNQLIVVDYKATAKEGKIKELDQEWHIGYKRQMEVYQWLLRGKGFRVSDTGYFVYANGRKNREAFDARLEFEMSLVPYTGSDTWVEKALVDAHACLVGEAVPAASDSCDWCAYRHAAGDVLIEHKRSQGENAPAASSTPRTLFDRSPTP